MKPILLLHGALGSKTQLDPLQASLADAGCAVYTMNLSGHGGAPPRDTFGIEVFADDVVSFLDANALEQVDIFGYSMGGYVALWLAHVRPERVDSIVTLGTKFDWSAETAAKETRKLDPEKILAKVPAFAQALEQRHAPNDWKKLLRKTAAMMTGLGNNHLLTDTILQTIRHEVFIMLGEQDDMADMVCSAKVSELLPHARFLLLENTPHAIEKVDITMLTRLLLDFFEMKIEAPVKPL